MMFTVSRRIRG